MRGDKDEIPIYIQERLGDEHVFLGGLDDLIVQWLDKDAKFIVHEYDGSDSLTEFENVAYFIA